MQLKFKLQGQRLTRTDRLCPVAHSKNFLCAEFEFSHQWSGCEKTAIFKNADGVAYSVLLSDDKCRIPYEVMGADFYVSVFGVKGELRITSDEVTVSVEASGYTEGETPQEPTQTVYEQILNRISESEAVISEVLDTSVQVLSEKVQTKFSTEIQETESRLSTGLQNLSTQLTQSIDTHTTDTNIHISADERALWNTVSDKANQSDLGNKIHLETETKADLVSAINELHHRLMPKEIFTISMTMSINGDVVTFDKTFQEVKEAYDNGLAIILMLNDMMVFPNIDYYDGDNTFCIEICRGDIFRVFLFYESGVIEEVAYREHVSAEEFYTFIGDRANFPTDSENVVDELNKQYQNIKANEEYIETLNEQMGNIETALDGIITIQNTLMGGGAV